MRVAICIPARYGSTRFPGKPLAKIAGQSMLSRVVDVARQGAEGWDNIDIFVATEDQRIADHAAEIGVDCVMTSDACKTGSDRALEAAKQRPQRPDFIINLQGDAPMTPPEIVRELINSIKHKPDLDVVTPAHQMSWDDLDALRDQKKVTPFSGTTCIRGVDGFALWFSKNIIPAIRDEETLRAQMEKSPVWKHMGIYGYKLSALEKFSQEFQVGRYEALEGLEQLRFLENGVRIYVADVHAPSGAIQSGIDSPEDLARAEAILRGSDAA